MQGIHKGPVLKYTNVEIMVHLCERPPSGVMYIIWYSMFILTAGCDKFDGSMVQIFRHAKQRL
jgi:hypothetical protein